MTTGRSARLKRGRRGQIKCKPKTHSYARHRLLLLNIKLAISNMHRYAVSRKVSLPGDDEESDKSDIAGNSASIPGETQFCIS